MGTTFLMSHLYRGRGQPSADLGLVCHSQARGRCASFLLCAAHSHSLRGMDDALSMLTRVLYGVFVPADPILAYCADGEVNQLKWSGVQPDWVAITFDSSMQILRV